MSKAFDSMITVPTRRAQSFPHWPDHLNPDAEIVDLDVEYLTVDAGSVEEGMVTLAASTRNSQDDAYGQEYDLTPTAARILGRQLQLAANECDAETDQADLEPPPSQ